MIMSSIAEIVSIGSLIPFLGIITAPEKIYSSHFMTSINGFLEIDSAEKLLLPFTVFFIISALTAGLIRFCLLYFLTRLSYAIGADFSVAIYKRTLYQDYSVHIARNSSFVINGILTKTNIVIGGVVSPILNFCAATMISASILLCLFFIDAMVATITTISLGVSYFIIAKFSKRSLEKNSKIIAEKSTQMVKSLQEGLGGIRDVLINNRQNFYSELYRSSDLPLRHASGNNVFLSVGPRYGMEALAITFIALLALFLNGRDDGLTAAIPILGAIALGGQRLLPLIQQAYHSYSNIKGSLASFHDVATLLDQELPSHASMPQVTPITFDTAIVLKKVGFRFNQHTRDRSPWIFRNISFDIKKGERVGIIGITGSGKSTLLDVIMGLLNVSEGELKVDGQNISSNNKREWQARIAHVPQDIFLSDNSIEENIAFGEPKCKINRNRVREVAKLAQIDKVIDKLEFQYETKVGERGLKLSGGQRQRIGIARALYKKADVLVFDEATSSLDNFTEKNVMDAINTLDRDLTIFFIAHRESTIQECDKIIEIKDGSIYIKELT